MSKHQCLEHGEVAFCDGCLIDSLNNEISQLKAQLNNMEACYIGKKKQVEDQQKRIDEALEDLEYPTAPWDETIASVVKVLRGES